MQLYVLAEPYTEIASELLSNQYSFDVLEI